MSGTAPLQCRTSVLWQSYFPCKILPYLSAKQRQFPIIGKNPVILKIDNICEIVNFVKNHNKFRNAKTQ